MNDAYNLGFMSLQSSVDFFMSEHIAPRFLYGDQVSSITSGHIAQSFGEITSGENNNSIA